jgi:hypothetical protein
MPLSNRSGESLVPDESKRNQIKSLNKINNSKMTTKEGSNDQGAAHNCDDVLNNEEMDNLVNPILYVRGVPCDSFYLILSGKVMICSGNEGFLVE